MAATHQAQYLQKYHIYIYTIFTKNTSYSLLHSSAIFCEILAFLQIQFDTKHVKPMAPVSQDEFGSKGGKNALHHYENA